MTADRGNGRSESQGNLLGPAGAAAHDGAAAAQKCCVGGRGDTDGSVEVVHAMQGGDEGHLARVGVRATSEIFVAGDDPVAIRESGLRAAEELVKHCPEFGSRGSAEQLHIRNLIVVR